MSFDRKTYMQQRRAAGLDDKYKVKNNLKLIKHRERIKEMAIAYKGGVCAACGLEYDPVCFDFHHADHTQKEFTISHIAYKDWDSIKPELDKCILVCANCHRIIHKQEKYECHKKQKKKEIELPLFTIKINYN